MKAHWWQTIALGATIMGAAILLAITLRPPQPILPQSENALMLAVGRIDASIEIGATEPHFSDLVEDVDVLYMLHKNEYSAVQRSRLYRLISISSATLMFWRAVIKQDVGATEYDPLVRLKVFDQAAVKKALAAEWQSYMAMARAKAEHDFAGAESMQADLNRIHQSFVSVALSAVAQSAKDTIAALDVKR